MRGGYGREPGVCSQDYEGRPSYMVANQAVGAAEPGSGAAENGGTAVFFLASALYMRSFFGTSSFQPQYLFCFN